VKGRRGQEVCCVAAGARLGFGDPGGQDAQAPDPHLRLLGLQKRATRRAKGVLQAKNKGTDKRDARTKLETSCLSASKSTPSLLFFWLARARVVVGGGEKGTHMVLGDGVAGAEGEEELNHLGAGREPPRRHAVFDARLWPCRHKQKANNRETQQRKKLCFNSSSS
jgi:hypothetical protein